jgi:hypothetical protein
MSDTLLKAKAQELKLKNYNGCFGCDAFVYIHFAPGRLLTDEDLQKIYYTSIGDGEMYLQIVDVLRFYFKDTPSIATLPATGMESHEWKPWWLSQHPETKPDTEMCVYYYKKKEQKGLVLQ